MFSVYCLVGFFLVSFNLVQSSKEIIIEEPFFLRARVHDSHTASVLFEIALENQQRVCRQYRFTVRRNQEFPYLMPEQNLTFWRNSLELKHLPVGKYRVCAIVCSERSLFQQRFPFSFGKRNSSGPVTTCVYFDAHRSHFLILTLYILVLLLLLISQVTYSLRKREFQKRIKMALIDWENSRQKWRATQPSLSSASHTGSYTILQNIVQHPAAPLEHSTSLPNSTDQTTTTSPSVVFHLEAPSPEQAMDLGHSEKQK